MNNEIHQHPDGSIFVRGDAGSYNDTYEHFVLDFGMELPELPDGADEQVYTQGVRHAFMGGGHVIAGGDMPWPEGDAIIADLPNGLAAQAERNKPPEPPEPLPPPPLMPACAVYSSAAQSIPANVPTRIEFDTAEFDVTGAFDLENNLFQPTVAGYYQVNCGCGLAAGAVQNYTSIYKNGVEYRRSTTSNEGGNTRLSTLLHLNGTTDYVEGYVFISKAFSTIPGGIETSFSAAIVQQEGATTNGRS